MAFPASPTEGQTFTENNTVWIYSAVTGQWYRSVINPLNETTYIGSDGAPGGIGGDTLVIFNDNGSLASDAGLIYNKTTDALTAGSFRATSLGAAATPSLTFTGDSNTGIYSPGADQLAASTAGVERLRITSAGRLGIGTSTPSAQLHVVNATLIDPSLTYNSAAGQIFRNELTELAFGTLTSGPYSAWIQARFSTSASQSISLNPLGGNVGIGTSSPSSLLHVSRAAGTLSDVLIETGSNAAAAQISFRQSGAVQWNVGIVATTGTFATAVDGGQTAYEIARAGVDVDRHVFSTGGSERLRITSTGVLQVADAGNIQVGTTTGTKIGTATTQKLGFYNATPVVQPAAVANATTAVDVITQLNDLLAKLRTLGIIAT